MSVDIAVRIATAADLPAARRLLEAEDLPVDDLRAEYLAFVAGPGDRLAGAIGLERHGATGLLRSLVVAPRVRGQGVGDALVAALETHAAAQGISELWLLTTSADAFFLRLGYTQRTRADAPAVVRATAQFSTLCPDSAVLMSKRLESDRS